MTDLYEAIVAIKEECNKHNTCNDCQLRTRSGSCAVSERTPVDWEIKTNIDVKPRLFR